VIATNIDAAFIRKMPHMLKLVTRFGDMDLVFSPAGSSPDMTRGSFARDQRACENVWLSPWLTSMPSSPRRLPANRPKDQRALPYLESLREQLG